MEALEAGPEAPPPYVPQHFEAPEPCAPHNPGAFVKWLFDQFDALSAGLAPKVEETAEGMGRNAIAGDRRLYKFFPNFFFVVERGFTFESYKAGREYFGGRTATRHEIVTYLFERSGVGYTHRKQVTNALTALISRGAVERANR